MAFQIVENYGRGKRVKNSVRVRIRSGRVAHFSLPRDALEEMRLSEGDRVDVLVGDGDDLGTIAVRKGSGYLLHKPGAGAASLNFALAAHRVGIAPVATSTIECKHHITDGTLYILIPSRIRMKADAINSVGAEPVADEDGWIPWHGGDCPVPNGTRVDVRYRSGKERYLEMASKGYVRGSFANNPFWRNDDSGNDIIAYRIASPSRSEAAE